MIDADYKPIDWHRDFKSGFRWSERCWYRDIDFGRLPGVDVKVPWELARMQHLPQLALTFALARQGGAGLEPPEHYEREFRNEVLDFIATNPPRYGVNWYCAMDVAIRVANWLIARDIFCSAGSCFDIEFEAALARSVHEHAAHIAKNLEWLPSVRGNHYLADVAGLLFASAYLPRSRQRDTWLAFATQEIITETKSQFTDDGANFEASTAYHRLSAEIVAYSTAMLLALPEERAAALDEYDPRLMTGPSDLKSPPLTGFTQEEGVYGMLSRGHLGRLEKMAEFTARITNPRGEIVQFGDNDSGRFININPIVTAVSVREARAHFANLLGYEAMPDDADYLLQNSLDQRGLVASIGAIVGRNDLTLVAEAHRFDAVFSNALAGSRQSPPSGPLRSKPRLETAPDVPEEANRYTFPAAGGKSLRDGLQLHSYPDFGLFIYHSSRIFLAVRCGPIGLNGLGAHAHNDQLSFELWIDKEPRLRDPGTYIYTALPARRDDYRSVTAHFAPHLAGEEQGSLRRGVFALGDEAKALCLQHNDYSFSGSIRAKHGRIFRTIRIEDQAIDVFDWTDTGLPLANLCIPVRGFSPGYGWVEN